MTDQERSRLGPPPIDPLSDAAWSRIERGLWSEMDAPGMPGAPGPARRGWLVAVPIVIAAAAAVVIVIGTRPAPVAPSESSRVVSGASPSSVSFGDIHIELDADSALVMSHEAAHPAVTLERGAAWFTVAPRDPRPAFVVHAGDATVRVVGTRFHVARAGEHSAVEVDHGKVEVAFHGRVAQVAAHQRWSSESAATTTIATAAAAALPDELPPPPASNTGSEPAPVHGSPSRPARPAPAAPAIGRAPSAPPTAEDERNEYERLAALEPIAPDSALAGYLALARHPGRWAAPALFAAGRLAADRHDPSATALLQRYLRRFPAGANASDARQLLARIARDAP